jgi:uncharacterized protein
MPGLGTLLNVAAIVAGATAGTLLGHRLPERLRDTLVAALGLVRLLVVAGRSAGRLGRVG